MKKVIKSMLALAVAAFAFTSCEDVPEPYTIPGEGGEEPVVIEPTGTGTVSDPYNVMAALDYVNALAADTESDQNVYIKGKVVSINTNYDESGTYGNAIFYISDDGTNKNQFYVYRALYLDNKKYTSGTTLQEGDEVVVCGKVVNYKGTTPETVQSKAWLYSLNGTGGSDNPTPDPGNTIGTADAPITASAAVEMINALENGASSAEKAYVKGKVVSVATNADNFAKYGNINYYISDDGTKTNQVQIYAGDGLNGAKFSSIDDIKAGDEVVVLGTLYKYVNKSGTVIPEITESYLVSQVSGGETPNPTGDAKGTGTLADPFNPLKAIEVATALGAGNTSTEDYYVKGKISTIKYKFDAELGTANFFISEDGAAANEFQVYGVLYLGNRNWVEGDTQIAVGDEVIIYGKLTNYNGTPETASKKACLYSLNGQTAGDDPTPNPNPGVGSTYGTLDGNVLTLTASELGVDNGVAVPSLTLVDGTKITFDGGGNNNVPKYYTSGASIRMYPKNSMAINASGKTIVSVTLNCTEQSGTLCNAGEEVGVTAGTVAFSGNNVNVTGVNGATLTITNNNGSTGAASQLRFEKLVITYSE